jgi:hypothetical protein
MLLLSSSSPLRSLIITVAGLWVACLLIPYFVIALSPVLAVRLAAAATPVWLLVSGWLANRAWPHLSDDEKLRTLTPSVLGLLALVVSLGLILSRLVNA